MSPDHKKYLVTFWVRNNYSEHSREVGIEVWAESEADASLAVEKLNGLTAGDCEVLYEQE